MSAEEDRGGEGADRPGAHVHRMAFGTVRYAEELTAENHALRRLLAALYGERAALASSMRRARQERLRSLTGRKPPDEGGLPGPDEPRITTNPARSPMTVLLVDDIQDTRDLYRHYFEFQGARALTAADGVEAMQVAAFERPDVIVLDLAMPRMTGLEVIRALRADARTRLIPILALSGQDARKTAIETGADLYCAKPCLPDKLHAEVVRLLREPPRGRRP